MNYENIQVEDAVNAVVAAAERGALRPAPERESLRVRLAALRAIERDLQENQKELAGAFPAGAQLRYSD